MKKEEARRQFAELIQRDEDQLELDRCALLIAAEEYPACNIDDYIARLDQLGEDFIQRSRFHEETSSMLLRLRDFLFVELGFRGNEQEYFDHRNSFLNEVLDRRTGIPITLSAVFLEVARRIGLPLLGVGMPGHFIVKCHTVERVIILDPYQEGRELTEEDCRRMVSNMSGGNLEFDASFLHAVNKRQILRRILQNLKGIYTRANDQTRLLGVIERLLLLNPDDPVEIRDRGLVYSGLSRFGRALEDFEKYLEMNPQASDSDEIKRRIAELRRRQAILN